MPKNIIQRWNLVSNCSSKLVVEVLIPKTPLSLKPSPTTKFKIVFGNLVTATVMLAISSNLPISMNHAKIKIKFNFFAMKSIFISYEIPIFFKKSEERANIYCLLSLLSYGKKL